MIDSMTIEIIRNALSYIAEETGIALRNSAYSPNIKERMDHSCALFDPQGNLLAQAEHIPVHLGSLPWGVKNALKYIKNWREKDIVIVNDPYIIGTHLNDITLIKPIFFNKKHYKTSNLSKALINKRKVFFEQTGWIQTPIYLRDNLSFSNQIKGPAIIEQYDATTIIPPGWNGFVDEFLNLHLKVCSVEDLSLKNQR